MFTNAAYALFLASQLSAATIEVAVDDAGHQLASARYQVEQVACDGRSLGERRVTVERSGYLDSPHPFTVQPGCYRVDFQALDAAGQVDARCAPGSVDVVRVGGGAARVLFVAECVRGAS